VSAPTRANTAGRAYLDLRKLARENHRPVDELLQLHVLEAFLDRLTSSRFTEQLVLKGGVLLAAFDERRPTRDIDLQAQAQRQTGHPYSGSPLQHTRDSLHLLLPTRPRHPSRRSVFGRFLPCSQSFA
jgi:Nucleotidyl transferase AbiEii toxin, Type IV TA system